MPSNIGDTATSLSSLLALTTKPSITSSFSCRDLVTSASKWRGKKMAGSKSKSSKQSKRSSKHVPWEQRFAELKKYKEEHGHCKVPQKWSENPPLGKWAGEQRQQHRLRKEGKKVAMSDEREAMLEGIGFEWIGPHGKKVPWEQRFAELKRYKEKHGHCRVPTACKETPQLAKWAIEQRTQYRLRKEGKKSAMSDERNAMLEGIGFRWSFNGASARAAAVSAVGAGGDEVPNATGVSLAAETADASTDVATAAGAAPSLTPALAPVPAEYESESETAARPLHQEEARVLPHQISMLQQEIARLRDANRRLTAERDRWKQVALKKEEGSTSRDRPTTRSSGERKAEPSTHEDIFREMIEKKKKRGDLESLNFLHDLHEDYLSENPSILQHPFVAIMTAKGVRIPRGFDGGVLYTGNVMLNTMPSLDTLSAWIDANKDKLSPRTNDKVIIKPSLGKGKGLYAARFIRKGEVIGWYCGVLREKHETHDSDYVFDLKNGQNQEIDAQYCGGPTRYINSPDEKEGEEANAVATVIDGNRIKIVAKKNIKKDVEILMDYGPDYYVDASSAGEDDE